MVFSSSIFLFFFLPIVIALYYIIRGTEKKNTVLLIASLLFYAWGEPVYVLLLIGSIIVNWKLGLLVGDKSQYCKFWLKCAVLINLLILFIFKYLGFVCDNLNILLHTNYQVRIVLPIGISFFTFQAMSYVVDVYRGKGEAQSRIRDVGLYISLFPQLIAGPIVRYETIADQMHNRICTSEKFSEGVRRFISGLGKKVILANNLALAADMVFEQKSAGGYCLVRSNCVFIPDIV